LMTRKFREEWQQEGSKDIATLIQEKLEDILKNHEVPSLPDKTLGALKSIREKREKEMLNSDR